MKSRVNDKASQQKRKGYVESRNLTIILVMYKKEMVPGGFCLENKSGFFRKCALDTSKENNKYH